MLIAGDCIRASLEPGDVGKRLAPSRAMGSPQTIVYVVKNGGTPRRYYTGRTSNMAGRLEAHNAGRVTHTASGRPWTIDVKIEFSDESRAVAFERYLKSGSGSAFASRHFR